MKIPKPRKSHLIAGLFTILIITFTLYAWNHWTARYRDENGIKHALTSELDKLSQPLAALGFGKLKVKASCGPGRDGRYYCTADTTKFVVYKGSLSGLAPNAKQLSDALDKNGWHQRPDFPTTNWFEKISQKVDYQPDQLNAKQVSDYSCTLDFFTSFSLPAPPAVTLNAICSKGNAPFVPLG